jgi:hypothetical protein
MSEVTGNRDISPNSLANLKPWPPGVSGNPNGRPKKDPITRIFERILENDGNVKAIEQAYIKILVEGRMASVLLTKEMLERTAGKVTQSVEVKADLREMSEEELLAKLATLRAELQDGQ